MDNHCLSKHLLRYEVEIKSKLDLAIKLISDISTKPDIRAEDYRALYKPTFASKLFSIWAKTSIPKIADTIQTTSLKCAIGYLGVFQAWRSLNKDILIGQPKVLHSIHKSFSKLSEYKSACVPTAPKSPRNQLLQTIESILDYESFSDRHDQNSQIWDAEAYCKILKIKACPYCNRSYISVIDSKAKWRPQLDHFYPKERYPLLRLSIYNLIPSCGQCNFIKRSNVFDDYNLNPFAYSMPKIGFTFRDPVTALTLYSNSYPVKFTMPNHQDLPIRISTFYNTLGIVDAYEFHMDEIDRMLRLKEIIATDASAIYQDLKFKNWVSESYTHNISQSGNNAPILALLHNDIGKLLNLF